MIPGSNAIYRPRPHGPGPLEQEQALGPYKAVIGRIIRLDLASYKEPYVLRRLSIRMRRTGVTNLDEYVRYLVSHTDERQLLIDALGVNVTEFLRDPTTFAAIRASVIPRVAQARGAHHTIRIWSAGCATGEEAYSLALVTQAVLDHQPGGGAVKVYATDIDEACLADARRAAYAEAQVRGVPRDLLGRYFVREGDLYMVKPELRGMVTFAHHDLTSPHFPGGFDVIVCRNVIIYFERSAHEELFEKFYHALTPWGFLVLGRTESVWGRARDLFISIDSRERIYQRVEGWGQDASFPRLGSQTSK